MIVQKATQSNIHTADIIHLAGLRLILARDRFNFGLVALLLEQETLKN